MVVATKQDIRIVLTYVTKGLRNMRAGVKNFNQSMNVPTQRMKELQTQQGTWDKRMKESSTRSGRLGLGLRKATHGLRGFRMEMLGVMFFGMLLTRTFSGLLKTSLEWLGVTEILSMTLGLLFLPVGLEILEWVIKFNTWVGGLSEETKLLIGRWVVFGVLLGGLLFIVGSFALGIGSLILVFGSLLTPIAVVLGVLAGFTIFQLLADWVKNSSGRFGELDTQLNAFGFTTEGLGEKIEGLKDKMITWITDSIPSFIESAGATIIAFARGIINNASKIGDAIKIFIDTIVSFVFDNIDTILEAGFVILQAILEGVNNNLDKVEEIIEKLIDALEGFIEKNMGMFIEIGARIAWAIFKGLAETLGASVRGLVSSITGKGIPKTRSLKEILGFQHGGVVPGRLGSPVPIIAHAGERITPANRVGAGGGGGSVFNVTYNIEVADKDELERMLRQNNLNLVEEVKRTIAI